MHKAESILLDQFEYYLMKYDPKDKHFTSKAVENRLKRIYGSTHECVKNFNAHECDDGEIAEFNSSRESNKFWFLKFKSATENRKERRLLLGIDQAEEYKIQAQSLLKGFSSIKNMT